MRKLFSILMLLAVFSLRGFAVEDPVGCKFVQGGLESVTMEGINFSVGSWAHIGDTVSVFPNLGMVARACRSINVTSTVYIATGPLTTFLVNATLDPGVLIQCPSDAVCTPGPYSFTLTSNLVGLAVAFPSGTLSGTPGQIKVVADGVGTLLNGLFVPVDFYNNDVVTIVNPAIRVAKYSNFPAGRTNFANGSPVQFYGYVTNTGDVTLTNVVATDTRTGAVTLVHPVAGTNLTGNVTLAAGAYAVFTNSFTASTLENCVCSGTNSITVTAQDNVGGPFSYVTNTYAAAHPIEFQPNP